jgi:fructose-1,6-bisphosphatase/inositol monophosphatase family enzyme
VTDEPDDLALAANLVRAAGGLAADMRRSGVQPTHKTSVTDLVTPADHAAEALIVNRLRAARPEDGIVAEEGSSQPGRRTWFVDPVDGTYNYATGITLWCSAVGLADGQ